MKLRIQERHGLQRLASRFTFRKGKDELPSAPFAPLSAYILGLRHEQQCSAISSRWCSPLCSNRSRTESNTAGTRSLLIARDRRIQATEVNTLGRTRKCLHTTEVAGSNPPSPTNKTRSVTIAEQGVTCSAPVQAYTEVEDRYNPLPLTWANSASRLISQPPSVSAPIDLQDQQRPYRGSEEPCRVTLASLHSVARTLCSTRAAPALSLRLPASRPALSLRKQVLALLQFFVHGAISFEAMYV